MHGKKLKQIRRLKNVLGVGIKDFSIVSNLLDKGIGHLVSYENITSNPFNFVTNLEKKLSV